MLLLVQTDCARTLLSPVDPKAINCGCIRNVPLSLFRKSCSAWYMHILLFILRYTSWLKHHPKGHTAYIPVPFSISILCKEAQLQEKTLQA